MEEQQQQKEHISKDGDKAHMMGAVDMFDVF